MKNDIERHSDCSIWLRFRKLPQTHGYLLLGTHTRTIAPGQLLPGLLLPGNYSWATTPGEPLPGNHSGGGGVGKLLLTRF